jgi:anti-sigma regulatory factor (Ser/Thr protein kinase)
MTDILYISKQKIDDLDKLSSEGINLHIADVSRFLDYEITSYFSVIIDTELYTDSRCKGILRKNENILLFGKRSDILGSNNEFPLNKSIYFLDKEKITSSDINAYKANLITSISREDDLLSKVYGNNYFGIFSFDEKKNILDKFERNLSEDYGKKNEVPTIVSIVDEIMINALRYAPGTESRKDPVFKFKIEKEIVHFSVIDYGGTLHLKDLLEKISKNFENNEPKTSGGMGLKNTLSLANLTSIFVEPNKQTIINCVFKARKPKIYFGHHFFFCIN